MAPRFKESLGRPFDDSTSDSSWSALEIKDLNPGLGSHIDPRKLKAAVDAGKLLDLDGFFGKSGIVKPAPAMVMNNAPAAPVVPEPLPGYGEQPKTETEPTAPSPTPVEIPKTKKGKK